MIPSALLLAAGLGVLLRPPCRAREAQAPRRALALVAVAAAAAWVGSFALLVRLLIGHGDGLLTACGELWHRVVLGTLEPWQLAVLAVWAGALPVRGAWTTGRRLVTSRRLLGRLRGLAVGAVGEDEPALMVPGLATPAVTLGVWRPLVLVDAGFWEAASSTERSIVLAHEKAHQRGRHGLIDAVIELLVAGLSPLAARAATAARVRRLLEALADDAAVRNHDAATVGYVVGRLALGTTPVTGLGVAGSALWRVRRLVMPERVRSWPASGLVVALTLLFTAGGVLVGIDAIQALQALTAPEVCTL